MQVEKTIPFAGRLKERSYTYVGENAIGGAQYGIGAWGHISAGDSSRIVHRLSQPACRSACAASPPVGVRRLRLSPKQIEAWIWSGSSSSAATGTASSDLRLQGTGRRTENSTRDLWKLSRSE